MRGHFPNNPRPPIALAYGFTNYLFISGSRRKLPSLRHWSSYYLREKDNSSLQNGESKQQHKLCKQVTVPLCEAEL